VSAFSGLKDEYVRCRTLLHSWEETDEADGIVLQVAFTGSRSVERINFKCTRCDALRLEGWSRVTGDLLWRAYRLPEGYRLTKNAGATRKRMRREFIERRRSTVKWEAPAPRRGRKSA
jgi:hypothetical protein